MSKRLRLPPILLLRLPRHPGTTPPGNCTWKSLSSTGGGGGGHSWVSVKFGERYVTVGGGGGVWPSVMKRYEGVGGGQIYGKNVLRNT